MTINNYADAAETGHHESLPRIRTQTRVGESDSDGKLTVIGEQGSVEPNSPMQSVYISHPIMN
ncbi:hypothetical protein [Rhodopirellula sallentina]|uniref:Uncharacterized protein n=1 Tax=Rhodopirellula sallentina SM41 TaxID=1263870 RepID=M5UJM7_9BACT|nr:hypothetical protein [Rhodopirellula sallentina]EMI56198.1 hypothetical protein RSSM_02355 [Rhodopirellula sallentina SM41]